MRLVDIGENRQALEVNMKIDESLSVIQDLQKCHIQLVFQPNLWQVMTKNYLTNMNFQLLNIFYHGFGIVGDVGNVNSSGINLSAEEADKMALADLFGKKKKMIKKRSKNLKLNKQNQTKSPKNLKWQQKIRGTEC